MICFTGISLPLYDNVHTQDWLQRTQKVALIVWFGGVGIFKIWVVPIFLVDSGGGFIAVCVLKPSPIVDDDVPIQVLVVIMF